MALKSTKTTKIKGLVNPFEGRNPEEVWKEISGKTKPISREEFLKQIKKSK